MDGGPVRLVGWRTLNRWFTATGVYLYICVIYPFLKLHLSKFYRTLGNGMPKLNPIKSHTQKKSFAPRYETISHKQTISYPRPKITPTDSLRILRERSTKVTRSCRKASKIAGNGSSIPIGNLLDFFSRFQSVICAYRQEPIGKNPKIFQWKYCFQVPAISGAFPLEPARIFRPGSHVSFTWFDQN